MLSVNFEKWKTKINRFLNNEIELDIAEVREQIRSDEFMNKISEDEADYLINMLPIDLESSDDEFSPEVSEDTGGINLEDLGGFKEYDPNYFDEFDLIQPEEKKVNSGFESLLEKKEEVGYGTNRAVLDGADLDDYDSLDDFFESLDKEAFEDDYEDDYKDDYFDDEEYEDEDEDEDDSRGGFFRLFKRK